MLILYFWTATGACGVGVVAVLPPRLALTAGGISVLVALALTLGPLRGRRAAARLAALEAGNTIEQANVIAETGEIPVVRMPPGDRVEA